MATVETTVDTILSPETQQFADDEIVDNFGAGPDDGMPMGLGGEKGKQATPASSTLEADIVAGPPTKQEKPLPGVDIPPESAAAGGDPKPVQDTAGDGGKAKTEPQVSAKPEAPEFPDALLQMAGFSSAEDAKKYGFKDPESLLAAVQWQSRSFTQPAKPARKSYLELPKTPETQPTIIPAEKPPEREKRSEGDDLAFKPFKPANPEIFDEELLKLIEAQNEHYAAQVEQIASRLKGRDADEQQRRIAQQVEQFDQAVQGLGAEWEAEFGKGDGHALFDRTDAESVMAAQNRLDMFDAVNLLRRANAERGGKPMTVQQEVQWALMQRFPDKFRQQLLRQRQAKAEARRGTQASRPTARTTPPGGRTERLLSSLQHKYPQVDFSAGSGEVEGDI